ncbi:MAG: hypothetical protein A2Z20_06845 [Bdellovibrionales bacterium RBG_16_40_8]|nr:MAG: hypothetical protein A2Z20_06845 [Bdellovibrionales bacterium RBG_16_40_8]
MSLNKIGWGIEAFDELSGGLPQNRMSVVGTPNIKLGRLILGHFLFQGIQNNERVMMLSHDSPITLLDNWKLAGLDLDLSYKNNQIYFLNYNPNIKLQIGLLDDYEAFIEEMKRLCDGELPNRCAIQSIDTLVNLSNIFLTGDSVNKLAAASRSALAYHTTTLGQFVKYEDQTHHDLAIAFDKSVSGYFEIDKNSEHRLNFSTKKVPWFNYCEDPTTVEIDKNHKFILTRKSLNAA